MEKVEKILEICARTQRVSHFKAGIGEDCRFPELRCLVPEFRKLYEANLSLDEQNNKGLSSSLGRSRFSNFSSSHEEGSLQYIPNVRCIRGRLGRSSSASNSKVSMARRMGPNVH